MKKIKVILVHGTFASMTNWDDCEEEKDAVHNIYKGDSPFVGQLRDELRQRDVDPAFASLNWSGDNSHQARREAALELNEMIQAQEGCEDCADGLFLIGHSHGGTVARLAVNLAPHDFDPDGVITFGSPFVRFEPRRVEWMVTAMVWSWWVTVAMLVLLLIGLVADVGWGVLAVLLFVRPIWRRIRRVEKWIQAKKGYLAKVRDDLCSDFDPYREFSVPHLNYHARFDEAGLLLRFWSLPTWVANTLFATLINTAIIMLAVSAAALTLDVVFALDLFPGLEAYLAENYILPGLSWVYGAEVPRLWVDELGINAIAAGGLTIMILVILTAIFAPVCIYLPWYIRKGWISFGGEAPSWTVASRISVDRMGSNRAEIRHVFLPSAWGRGRMQHNYYYEDPRLVTEVAERLSNWKIRETRHLHLERRLFGVLSALVQIYIFYLALQVAIDIGIEP
ncbi:MAG: hypothetical protein AAGE80_00395 [Pseudomonadota bacterium]